MRLSEKGVAVIVTRAEEGVIEGYTIVEFSKRQTKDILLEKGYGIRYLLLKKFFN